MPPNDGEVAVLQAEVSIAPLPPPDELARYEQILPGTANRLITMMEKEQARRHDEDKKAAEARKAAEKRGQWFGFIIAVTGVIVAGVTAIEGHMAAAISVAVCSTSGGGLFWFLHSRRPGGN